MLSILSSIKVLIGKDNKRAYRGARVKQTTVTAIEYISANGRYLIRLRMISQRILYYTEPKWAVLSQNVVVLVGAWQKWATRPWSTLYCVDSKNCNTRCCRV
jgi:hypothetical protein